MDFRIRCRGRGLLKNIEEAGVWGGVDDGVEGIEEVFPIVCQQFNSSG
jgi:hypothetical protein